MVVDPVIAPDLIEIPAGTFLLGDDRMPDASPRHSLKLATFRIGKFPVTNAEFADFLSDNGYTSERFWTPIGWRWLQARKDRIPAFWNDAPFNAPRQPVVGVSWYEAVAYSNWLSEKSARRFRLLSEAEWEKAARGHLSPSQREEPAVRVFPWGERFENHRANTAELGLGRTTLVDAFPFGASPYGVMDLAGNVYEWTLSKWGHNWQELEFTYPYRADDGREEIEGSAARVMRGGSWFNPYQEAHVSRRARFLPGSRASNIGFRLGEVITVERGASEPARFSRK